MLSALKAAGLIIALLLAVYVPAFVVTGLWKPAAAAAVPTTIGITFVLAVALMLFRGRSWQSLENFGFGFCKWRYLLAAIVLAIPLALGLTYMAQLLPASNPLPAGRLAPWMTVVYFLILAPVSEETIFRGLLQTTLAGIFPDEWSLGGIRLSTAAFGIALLFGLLHLKISVLTAIAAFFLGLLAGELRQRSGSLLPAFLVHAVFNAAGLLWAIR